MQRIWNQISTRIQTLMTIGIKLISKLKFLSFISAIFLISSLTLIPVITVNAASYTDVSVLTAYEITNNHTQYPNLLILDVREQYEYDENHLFNATLIPIGQINARINELLPYNETEILVYCRSGSRSALASQNLAGNHNFSKIFNMLGGITNWISAGYPVWTPNNGNNQLTIDFTIDLFIIVIFGAIGIIAIYDKKFIKNT